jgi:peroxiredoxin
MNFVNHPVVNHKLGLLNLAEELGNVSRACKIMGVSRDTFYRYQEAKAEGGLDALLHKDKRRPNLKNRVDDVIEVAVLAYALEQPAHGQVRVSNELRQRGTFVIPVAVFMQPV